MNKEEFEKMWNEVLLEVKSVVLDCGGNELRVGTDSYRHLKDGMIVFYFNKWRVVEVPMDMVKSVEDY